MPNETITKINKETVKVDITTSEEMSKDFLEDELALRQGELVDLNNRIAEVGAEIVTINKRLKVLE